jgi:hypothetical protein
MSIILFTPAAAFLEKALQATPKVGTKQLLYLPGQVIEWDAPKL